MQSFEIRVIDPFLALHQDGNYCFGYPDEMDMLQKNVLEELKSITRDHIRHRLKKLANLKTLFSHFDNVYPELLSNSQNRSLSSTELKKSLFLFNTDNLGDKEISPIFLKTLYISIVNRQRSVQDLINKTEDFLANQKQQKTELVEST